MKTMEARLWRGARTTAPFIPETSGRPSVADQPHNPLSTVGASICAASVLADNAAEDDRAPEEAICVHYGKIFFARR